MNAPCFLFRLSFRLSLLCPPNRQTRTPLYPSRLAMPHRILIQLGLIRLIQRRTRPLLMYQERVTDPVSLLLPVIG